MIDRRPTPAVWTIVATVALVGALLIVTGRADGAAVAGGFVPARVGGGMVVTDALPVWLTPLVATLIHRDWSQLGFSLLLLLIIGAQTQRATGIRGMAVLWVVGAYVAAIGQWMVDPALAYPIVGAAGAISALLGAYALLFGDNKTKPIGPLPAHVVHALWLGAGWIALSLLIGWTNGGGREALGWAIGQAMAFITGMALLRPLLKWRWRAKGVVGM